MPRSLATVAARHTGRPLLMTHDAAAGLAQRLREVDARAFERPGRISALLRRIGSVGRGQPMAMEDEDAPPPEPFHVQAAYSPLYIGEPDDVGYCWSLKDGVALMEADTALSDRGEVFCGTVYHGYDTLLAGMQEAAADSRVGGIFIRMASPGGVVAGGLPTLAEWMRANRQAAGGKPIHVYADMACSAAYWISAQADKIWAPRVGLVGSIGAVIVHEDWSAALKEYGVNITAIQFGASKTDGAWWEALSPTAKAALQAEIDQCGRDFVADVAAGREKLTPEALIETQAAVYMANHDEKALSGLDLGFVDEISGEEAAFSALAAEVSTPQALGVPQTARTGSRAAKTTKEEPMAVRPETKAARMAAVATAQAALTSATATLAAAEAKAASDDEDCAEDGDGDDTATAPEANDGAVQGEPGADSTEASAIAASAEAKSHPAMALAAIGSGQTLAQFQASVTAAGAAPAPKGALAAVLGVAPRLGPDAAAKTGVRRTAAQIFEANSAAGRKK